MDEFLLHKVHLWLESQGSRAEEKLVCPKQTKSARQAELTGGTMGDFLCSFGNLKNDQQNESRGKNVSPALNTLTCGRTPQWYNVCIAPVWLELHTVQCFYGVHDIGWMYTFPP